jgi:hypothetical protein
MSFVSTQGWDPDTLVDYRINEDEFHKISLLDCDFFIRKPPDPDNDVYDFREVGSLLLCYCHPFHSTSTFVVTYYFNCVEYFCCRCMLLLLIQMFIQSPRCLHKCL